MGTIFSVQQVSDGEEYEIPLGETHGHQNCTVRAPRHLIVAQGPRKCDTVWWWTNSVL